MEGLEQLHAVEADEDFLLLAATNSESCRVAIARDTGQPRHGAEDILPELRNRLDLFLAEGLPRSTRVAHDGETSRCDGNLAQGVASTSRGISIHKVSPSATRTESDIHDR